MTTAVRVGTLTAAAPLLFVATGSAVGKQIQSLEDELGLELVSRTGGRIRLTPAGQRALPHLLAILEAEEALNTLNDKAKRRKGER